MRRPLCAHIPRPRDAHSGPVPAIRAEPVPNLDDDGTYKYYDSSRDPDSPAYVSPSIRYQWKHSTLSRWDVGNPLPQSAPAGTVLQSKDGTPTDFWCERKREHPILRRTSWRCGRLGRGCAGQRALISRLAQADSA